MKLPNGITGFYHTEETMPPKVDGQLFKRLCFAILTEFNGKIIDFKNPQYPKNYYDVQVNIFNQRVHLLLNEHYPFLSFCSISDNGNIQFMDIPQLCTKFSPYYTVLNSKLLLEPIDINMLSDLNNSEIEQINYWGPERVGDVVFNVWD